MSLHQQGPPTGEGGSVPGRFYVWVVEFQYLEKGGDAANPEDWYDTLQGIYWTRAAALRDLRDHYWVPGKFEQLVWWHPSPQNLDEMQCGIPWEEHAGIVLRKAEISP